MPSSADGTPGPQHRGTVHFESHLDELDAAFREVGWLGEALRSTVRIVEPSYT